MTLNILTQFNAKNFTTAANVPAAWRIGPRTITSITIHWWGNPVGQTFGGIVDWFCNPQSSVTTSAHFVASADQVACIVSPEDAAWHAGSAEGNVHSIGIECNPRCSDGDYQSIAELVAWLRSQYGDLPLVPHNRWTETNCPGDYRLDRIDALARGQVSLTASEDPITQDWFDMATQQDLIDTITNPAVLDAIALAILKRPCNLVDPSGKTGEITGSTTLAAKINWAAHNDAQILTAVADLHTALQAVPATAVADVAAPVAVTDDATDKILAKIDALPAALLDQIKAKI